jgi:hypothetical protein
MPSSPPTTNLILWLEADAGLYKDTAGTIPATADGDLVALWKDQGPGGNDVKQATSGNRPILKTSIVNAKPVVRFLRASAQSLATAASVAHGIGTGDFWFTGVYATVASPGNFNSAFSIGSFAPAFYLPYATASNKANFYLGGNHDFPGSGITGGTWYLTEVGRISGTVKCWHSSGGVAPALDATTFSLGGSIANASLLVGYENSGTDYFSGDLAEILLYKASLNSTDQAALENYLRSKYWSSTFANTGAVGVRAGVSVPPVVASRPASAIGSRLGEAVTTRLLAAPITAAGARGGVAGTSRTVMRPITAAGLRSAVAGSLGITIYVQAGAVGLRSGVAVSFVTIAQPAAAVGLVVAVAAILSTRTIPPQLRQAVYLRLMATAGVTDLVGDRIYFGALPQSINLQDGPALTYQVISRPYGHVLTGSDGTSQARVQITAHSYRAKISNRTIAAVNAAFDGYRGPMGGVDVTASILAGRGDMPAPPMSSTDQWTYSVHADYQINHRVTLPSALN